MTKVVFCHSTAVFLMSLPMFLVVGSCASETRRPLSECDHGLYWAECGGNGPSALGCDRSSGDCRWFSGGETAAGYVVSDCPLTDICCHEFWPFTDFDPSGPTLDHALDQMGVVLGVGVIGRRGERDLPVEFDLTEETQRGVVRCSGGEDCRSAGYPVTTELYPATAVVRFGEGGVNPFWELEIVPAEMPSAWSARLYSITPGSRGSGPAASCVGYSWGREPLVAGTLHLSSDQITDLDALHGRVEGVGETGTEITVEF